MNYSHAYAQPLSTSPTNYNPNEGGFVPINAQSPTNTVGFLDTSQSQFPIPSDPIAIPQSVYGVSPPFETEAVGVIHDFFATNLMVNPTEIPNQGPENWTDFWNPQFANLPWGSNGNTWEGAYEMQPLQSSQGQDDTTPIDNRRGSLYFPTVMSLCTI
jgi:hypothetical protein